MGLQVLLRVGIVRSRKAPTLQHPYGYLKDKFVWSLVSAVGIFCLGAGITTAHGFSSLMAGPQELENLGYGLSGATHRPFEAKKMQSTCWVRIVCKAKCTCSPQSPILFQAIDFL